MHRSSSYYLSSSSSAPTTSEPSGSAGVLDVDQLPTYDPRSDAAKEALDASRAGLARTLVHLVPVVVLLCGLLLRSLSAAEVSEVGVLVGMGSGHKTVERVKLVTDKSESSSSWNSSSKTTATGGSYPVDKSNSIKRRELRSEM